MFTPIPKAIALFASLALTAGAAQAVETTWRGAGKVTKITAYSADSPQPVNLGDAVAMDVTYDPAGLNDLSKYSVIVHGSLTSATVRLGSGTPVSLDLSHSGPWYARVQDLSVTLQTLNPTPPVHLDFLFLGAFDADKLEYVINQTIPSRNLSITSSSDVSVRIGTVPTTGDATYAVAPMASKVLTTSFMAVGKTSTVANAGSPCDVHAALRAGVPPRLTDCTSTIDWSSIDWRVQAQMTVKEQPSGDVLLKGTEGDVTRVLGPYPHMFTLLQKIWTDATPVNVTLADGTTAPRYRIRRAVTLIESSLDSLVTVPRVDRLIALMQAEVADISIPAFTNKLRNILDSYVAGNTVSACSELSGFVDLVNAQAGKKRLTATDAAELLGYAAQLRTSLQCK